ncbi:uncharacterized protein LAESUDRAFT_728851 [Laetiporus sulphureus 93-53]|uniref:Uncharacterized protein n=1 Tax=Laetiporus sulphureus 93-53 TaxID=1314785 RepID=A0A165CZM4_9APHY|nr:uncharacterized protein LAESUDRAFT_728851 [Laetiporus sulphureus 93-53]KZT03830.1 hypothetical protein LAESUDRAFT_728851 [Laetiporus sulphureus 93-53]
MGAHHRRAQSRMQDPVPVHLKPHRLRLYRGMRSPAPLYKALLFSRRVLFGIILCSSLGIVLFVFELQILADPPDLTQSLDER